MGVLVYLMGVLWYLMGVPEKSGIDDGKSLCNLQPSGCKLHLPIFPMDWASMIGHRWLEKSVQCAAPPCGKLHLHVFCRWIARRRSGIDDWVSMIEKVCAMCRPPAAHCTSIFFQMDWASMIGHRWVPWNTRTSMVPCRNHKNIHCTLAQPGLTLCHAATVHRKALQISLPRWMDVHDAWSLPLNRTKIRWTAKLIWYCSLWYYKSLGVVFEQIRFTRQSSWWFKWPSKCPEIHKSWKHGVSIVSHAAFLRKRRGIDP